MESSEEWIRATRSCPSLFVDMGFLQQYVHEFCSDKAVYLYWFKAKIHTPQSFYDFEHLVV